jgi:hypothetical protein
VLHPAPVSHSVHFLQRLDRVPRSLTDLALGLYRDEDRVRWILHYAHLPKDQERVALALDEGGDGPYIVVTREGRFVTALGYGMTPKNLTVLTRSQVDTFSARVDEARKRMDLAKEIVAPGKRPVDMLGLLTTRPWGLSREEFSAIAGWVPIMNLRFLVEIFEAVSTMGSFRDTYLGIQAKAFRKHRRTRETLESMWNMSHGIAARYLLATMGELVWVDDFAAKWTEDYGPTWYATDERIFAVAVRGAWAAARLGKALLPTYKRILSMPRDSSVSLDAVLALTAIGLRHAHLRDDARRIIATLLESEEEDSLEWAKQLVTASDRVFDHPEDGLSEVALYGARMLRAKVQLAPHASELRFARDEDVPREMALAVAVNQTFDSFNPFSFYVLPWVAKLSSAEELYCPEALAQVLRQPLAPELMAEVYERQNRVAAPSPVTRDAKPGRNDACSCGSGKKFKKCCGK